MDRQRLLMIFAAAWVSAALLTWFLYARTKAPKTEAMARIVAAARDLPAGTRIGKDDVRLVSVAQHDVPKGAVLRYEDIKDRALLVPVNSNEPITVSRLSSLAGAEGVAATIEPGKRAVSVAFTDASGASGLIQPRSRVDVLFTRSGGGLQEALTVTLLEDVPVLSVGRVTEVKATDTASAAARSQNQTATLMVTPEDAKKLELAKNHGKISLALRNPLDRSRHQDAAAATAEALDPFLLKGPRRRLNSGGRVRDSKDWASLTGEELPPKKEEKKEPPKPKVVVDVFRGDKHVQEVFQ